MPDFDLVSIRKQPGCMGPDVSSLLKYSSVATLIITLIAGADIGFVGCAVIDHKETRRITDERTNLIALVKAGANPVDAACSLSMIDPDSDVCVRAFVAGVKR
ncbi:hypothetical protein [Gluconobacter oxydans]|uniref:hypothetical protein n=1 Tax=Gluconobacter oxydans TaxID=442 RepID=UPI003464E58D